MIVIISLPLFLVVVVCIGIPFGACVKVVGIIQDWWCGVRKTYVTWKLHPTLHYEQSLSEKLESNRHQYREILWNPRQYWRLTYPNYPGCVLIICMQIVVDIAISPFRIVSGAIKFALSMWREGKEIISNVANV